MTLRDLQEMRALIPVLNEIDDQTLSTLDQSEWYRPSMARAQRLKAAADELGVHIMTYRANSLASPGRGLCNVLETAQLDAAKMNELSRLEATCPGAVIVAYARPTRRRH